MKPKSGDTVKIMLDECEYEGTLMPRPEIFDKGCTVIKLSNGYNIGISNKKIKKISVVREYAPLKEKKYSISAKKGLPNVSIISFGGTISSKVDYRTGGAYADYTAEDFVEMLPQLESMANIKAKKAMGIMSEDMNPQDWKIMAEKIGEELNNENIEGVVVTQGTDTLHFSTAAMSFFLRNLNKPVIFTAAQRSIDRGSSDAFLNLTCSVAAASAFNGAEVVTCMHGTSSDNYCILNRGTKVRKMHTARRDAFRPINELPLAKVFDNGGIEIINSNYRPKDKSKKVLVDNKFEPKTGLLYVYPGINPEILDFYLSKKYKGIVIAATALGHVATLKKEYSLLPKIKKLVNAGISVVIASQTTYGRTHPYVYTNLRRLSVEIGCIYASDTMPEVAYVKLGWILGHTKNPEEVKKMMIENYAGEITERSDAKSFLY